MVEPDTDFDSTVQHIRRETSRYLLRFNKHRRDLRKPIATPPESGTPPRGASMQAMTEGDEPPQPRLWRYPRQWMCQEQFWWEMFNRTLANLMVALVILLAGESAGLFHQPWSTVGKAVLAGGVWVSLLGVAVAALGLVQGWRDRARDARDAARAPKLEAQPAEQEAQHQAGEGSDEPEDGKPQREV